MEKYWIEISDIAKHDIRGIGKYIINEFKEPIVAANIVDAILDAIFTLEDMPDRIALVKDKHLAEKSIRPLYVKNYTIFFRINETRKVDSKKTVEIVRVLYSHRDWASLL